ncbi:MAG TPA: ABC transporter permease subunit [Clostridiales bacterium]|nr:ABC transporter permease subunit [Clostridiales bacterium]
MNSHLCKKNKKEVKRINPYGLKLFLLALPFVVLVFMFRYVPLLGWSLAFFNYKPGLSFDKMQFVGLKYFKLIGFFKEDVINALINTLVMSGLSLLTSPLPVIFAILLTELRSSKFRKVLQTTVTLPHFVSWVIVYSLCFGLFSSNGLVNNLLLNVGSGKQFNLLANADKAWLFMLYLGIWKSLGWDSIIYLAAISSIEQTLYEAAKIDGAGRFRCIWHIVIPGVMPTFIVLLLLQVSNILSAGFEKYFAFNNVMVAEKLEVLEMYIYRIGIGTQDYSFATAVGIIKSAVSLTLLFSVNSLAKHVRGESLI